MIQTVTKRPEVPSSGMPIGEEVIAIGLLGPGISPAIRGSVSVTATEPTQPVDPVSCSSESS